jgi:hypothetical protein
LPLSSRLPPLLPRLLEAVTCDNDISLRALISSCITGTLLCTMQTMSHVHVDLMRSTSSTSSSVDKVYVLVVARRLIICIIFFRRIHSFFPYCSTFQIPRRSPHSRSSEIQQSGLPLRHVNLSSPFRLEILEWKFDIRRLQ